MAKKTDTNIVTIWNWLIVQLNSGKLNANEQLTLVHIISFINKNMWQPTPINPKIIAAAIGRDPRTVNNAIAKLIELNLIAQNEGGYNIGNNANIRDFPKGNQSQDLSGTDNFGRETESSSNDANSVRTSNRKRKLFH